MDIMTVYGPNFFFQKAEYKEEILDKIILTINNFIDNNSEYENNIFIYISGEQGIG